MFSIFSYLLGTFKSDLEPVTYIFLEEANCLEISGLLKKGIPCCDLEDFSVIETVFISLIISTKRANALCFPNCL